MAKRPEPEEWYAEGLQFECTLCGACCTGPPGLVEFTRAEGIRMARALGLTFREFLLRYARRTPEGWAQVAEYCRTVGTVLAADPGSAWAQGADGQAPLDAALGADLDVSESPDNPSLVARGTSTAGDAALGAVRHAAEGVIPFRGWVRKLSGAERYERRVEAAITAGGVRRAFLRGVATAKGC